MSMDGALEIDGIHFESPSPPWSPNDNIRVSSRAILKLDRPHPNKRNHLKQEAVAAQRICICPTVDPVSTLRPLAADLAAFGTWGAE